MPGDDATARYRNYLATFGITQPGDRVVEQRGSERGGVRFFAYADGAGLRLKAAVTPDGLVTPGPQRDDDWHGFLAAIGDAEAAADRIAWLESDEAERPHGFPIPPWTVAGPASLQTTAQQSIQFSNAALREIPDESFVMLGSHQAGENLHASRLDNEIVVATPEFDAPHLFDAQPAALCAIIKRKLLQGNNAMRDAM